MSIANLDALLIISRHVDWNEQVSKFVKKHDRFPTVIPQWPPMVRVIRDVNGKRFWLRRYDESNPERSVWTASRKRAILFGSLFDAIDASLRLRTGL